MISEREAMRAEAWVQEAVAPGRALRARRRAPGRACCSRPSSTDVDPAMRVMCEEIFAPVVSVVPFDTLDEAIAQVNATPFGLAAGIFTQRHHAAR